MKPEPLILLVVEDDPTVRRALARLLDLDPRVRVLEAADGLDALSVLESQPVDVVISDENMPRISGLRLLETMKGRWPGIRRVLYSGQIDADVVMQAVNRGGVHKVLSKGMPASVTRAELTELVDLCMAQRVEAGSSDVTVEVAVPGAEAEPGRGALLLLSDRLALRTSLCDALRADGLIVHAAETTGPPLSERCEAVIVDLTRDLSIEGILRRVREHDLDAPIIAVVSRGDIDLAHEAIRLGAQKYLVHPIARDALRSTVRTAMSLGRLSKARTAAVKGPDRAGSGLGDRAGMQVRFDRAVERLYMVYQPLVARERRRVIGYEALLRSEEPSMGNPASILEAAQRLGRLDELGVAIRRAAVQILPELPPEVSLFLNLHVADVASADLLEPHLVQSANRIVLEITERAALDSVEGVAARLSSLRARGYRVAIDDLGAGYAGLSSFASVDPDLVKLDMSLVRDVHLSPTKRRLVRSLQEACSDLALPMIVEGVETAEELAALVAAGCDFFQGYLFARPARTLGAIAWA